MLVIKQYTQYYDVLLR